MTSHETDLDAAGEELVLADLLNHVLDRGVVITGEVTLSVANIDLVRVGVSLFIAAAETLDQRARADVPVLPDRG